MKSVSVIAVLAAILFTGIGYGQLKIGYVDSDAIMDNLPDAQDAHQKIDALVQEWQTELNKMESNWKAKYDDYEKRKLIMSDQTRVELEAELVKLEQGMTDYREKKFGTNGELFQKQDELMKPVQNKIFNAIQEIAKEQDLDFVFDKSGDVMLLYAKDQYDITQTVLEKLKLQ
ncbi:MAG TPA: OmpH family outer membrane protein [Ignavibacteriaceae bacterium]|nr:OmpH family outer membrane protein [Ignavibacteriaceae bacterium]